MRHPTEGTLRRLIDEPAGISIADRDHIRSCDRCLSTLADMRDDATRVGRALQVPGMDRTSAPGQETVHLDGAWTRLAALVDEPGSAVPVRKATRRRKVSIRRPAVAAAAAVVVLAGAGVAAASDWFQIFRTEEVAPLAFRVEDLNALPDLGAYGRLETSDAPNLRAVPEPAMAEEQTGLEVPRVSELPRGVQGESFIYAGDEVSATFTFSAARAADAAARAGEPLEPPPPGLDGSPIRLVAGPGVASMWMHPTTGIPSLFVMRAKAPTAHASGSVPFDEALDYLLGMPGLPEDVAARLRTFRVGSSRLPIPVPEERFTTSVGDVAGRRATVLATRDRSMAAVVWVEDGVMTVVAGPLSVEEVLDVARGLT